MGCHNHRTSPSLKKKKKNPRAINPNPHHYASVQGPSFQNYFFLLNSLSPPSFCALKSSFPMCLICVYYEQILIKYTLCVLTYIMISWYKYCFISYFLENFVISSISVPLCASNALLLILHSRSCCALTTFSLSSLWTFRWPQSPHS